MHQLVGRLTALDPEASESLKAIAYFDALVDGHANSEVLLRGAAVLSGCASGFAVAGSVMRMDAAGIRSPLSAASAQSVSPWPRHSVGDAGYVWLERGGAAHANDAMILERLAISLGITLERSAPVAAQRRAIETVLDTSAARADRLEAAARLRLDAGAQFSVHAVPAAASSAEDHQAVFVTGAGLVRAVIRDAGRECAERPAGIGFAASSADLDSSWQSALLALRMTSRREPVLHADDLGALLLLVEADSDERAAGHPDVRALKRVVADSSPARELIESLIATGSVRAAARELGLHHSTVQARVADLSQHLGFDVRTLHGHGRLTVAYRLFCLVTNTFD